MPKISFTSPNVNSNSVRLTFNGKRVKISETIVMAKDQLNNNCNGRFSWQAEVGSQQDSGTVNLFAGDEETVTLDFLSTATIVKIKRLASTWRRGHVIEGAAGLWFPSHDESSQGEEIGDKFGIATSLNNIGFIYV